MIALLFTALSAQAAAPPVSAPPRDLCAPPRYRVIGPGAAPGLRKLTQLPPGTLMLAVDKQVGGCSVNVLKAKDLAGNHVMVPAGPARSQRTPVGKRER